MATNKPYYCQILLNLICPCYNGKVSEINIEDVTKWRKRIKAVTEMPEFHDREDFEVTFHPFFEILEFAEVTKTELDFAYSAADCLHPSQKGHASLANAYWNSLLTTPSKRLNTVDNEFELFLCPTESSPFIRTSKN
jgi:hypothetical protein